MIGYENTPNSLFEARNEDICDMPNSGLAKKIQFHNTLSSKMDALIELTEISKNKIALLESHNKTKGKEVEREFDFLKQVGDICKRSCKYYLEANISFHESCENFNILFKIFNESLLRLKEKNKIAETNEIILKDIEEKEKAIMIEKKDINERQKKELEELEKELHFMNNESKNITNKIKEIDYQINQHKEAFESFFILTNLNHEKNAILENNLKDLKKEEGEIIDDIKNINQQKTDCCQNRLIKEEQLEIQRKELIQSEKELNAKKEHMTINKNDLLSNISILESQTKFLENQITSQEYYLNVITSGYEGSVKRKEELAENIEHIKCDIDEINEKIETTEIEQNQEKGEQEEIKKKIKILENDLEIIKEELKNVKEKKEDLNIKVITEKKNLGEDILNNLTKEKNCIEEKIANYKEEIKTLLIDEKKKVHLLKDVNVEYKDNKSLVKHLETVLEQYKIKIKEEQEKQWVNERGIKKIQVKIKEVKEKIEEEEQKKEEVNTIFDTRNEELAKIKKKNIETEKQLGNVKKEKAQLEAKYVIQNEEMKKIENKLCEMNKKVECSISQLHKEYEEKTKNLYDGKTKKVGLESLEKKQIQEEYNKYFQQLTEEYELKKKEFKEESTKKWEESNKKIDDEIKKKDELIAYYKELLSKLKTKNSSEDGEYLKSSMSGKKVSTTQNLISKKNELSKLYHKRNLGNKNGNGVDCNSVNNTTTIDSNENKISNNNENKNNENKNNTHLNNMNRFKLYNISEPYKFGYFDVTSPEMIRNNIKTQNRSIKSPHITRLLEKIKNRKDFQNLGNTKKTTSFQSGKNNKNFYKMKPTKNSATFDLFQHF